MGIQRAQAVIERGDSGRAWMVLEDVAHGIREALAAEELERGADRGSEVGVMDERVERVARELHAMDHEVSDACKPWEDAHQDAYREMAGRVLRVAYPGATGTVPVYVRPGSRPEPVSEPEPSVPAWYRDARVRGAFGTGYARGYHDGATGNPDDAELAEEECLGPAGEPERAPGAEPVERCGKAIPGSVWKCMLPKGHEQHSVRASPPSERAGPKPEPIGRCADCGSHETPVGEYPLTSCISCGAPWRNYAREERAGERDTALREALEEAETSLTAVAMHSVQDLMRNDARRVVMQIREALATSPAPSGGETP